MQIKQMFALFACPLLEEGNIYKSSVRGGWPREAICSPGYKVYFDRSDTNVELTDFMDLKKYWYSWHTSDM